MISPLAYVDPEAKIGQNCEIGPFCFIDKNVVIGDNNVLMNNVSVLYGARIGNGNTIFPGAVISAVPQDLKFQGEETTAEIGDNNRIRENVTINRGTKAKGRTRIGNGNLLMETVHVAHDATIGNECVISNGTKLAGETIVDDYAIISANVLLHQFCRIGSYAMVGGGTRSSQSILPYTIAAREPVSYCGLNYVGLRRRNFSNETIEQLHRCFQIILGGGKLSDNIEKVKTEIGITKEVQYLIQFIEDTQNRGFVR